MADALTQIVEKLEENSNILVTVNTNPTVETWQIGRASCRERV